MSRAPPYSSRQRSGSSSNPPVAPTLSTLTSQGVRPLQINHSAPGARPSNNNNSTPPRHIPTTLQIGPSRPQRSELRNRPLEQDGYERVSTSSRELIQDSFSNAQIDFTDSPATLYNGSPRTEYKAARMTSQDNDVTSPASLVSAISAFQSAGLRRRAMTNDSDDMEYERARQQELENEKNRQRRIQERAPGRKFTGRTNIGDIDAVLDQVKDGWEFVIEPDVRMLYFGKDLALQPLEQSSQGKDFRSFRTTKDMLSTTLKGSVDRYYQAFASSLPHHASVINRLSKVQSQVIDARSSLIEAKEALGNKRADLVQLWSRSNVLEEMIRLLDQIEYLKAAPDLLETLISEKRLLQASVLLVRSMKLINRPDMLEIGAVSDLRSYLTSQDTALRDILIDELQSHLYLKSFWCETRWCAYVPNQKTFPIAEYDDMEAKPVTPSVHHARLKKYLDSLMIRPNDPPHDLGESNPLHNDSRATQGIRSSALFSPSVLNPEADSFTYMETLIESLAVLGKLGAALDTISQRLSGELFALVETTRNEVEERAEFGRRSSTLGDALPRPEDVYVLSNGESLHAFDYALSETRQLLNPSSLRLAALEAQAKQADHEILRDFFWTLYSKLDAVVQGFRIASEVANRVGSRRDFKDSSGTKPALVFPLDEVWYPIQAELHNLIRDYLVDEEQTSSSGRNPILSINEVLREGKLIRDRNKAVFRLTDTDPKLLQKSLRPHEEELTRVLKDTMPGLAPGSTDTIHASIASAAGDDRLLSDQHHQLLIHPDAFYVNVLFQPTLCFLDQIADLLPAGIETLRSFSGVLDDFVLKMYLPQLEEKVSDLFHQAVSGPDAFESDLFSLRFSREPLIQAGTRLFALINSLCASLALSPFHRENYTRLILSVIIQFYQRCSDQFQDLVTVRQTVPATDIKLIVSAQWSQKSEITSCLTDLFLTFRVGEDRREEQEQRCKQETEIELGLLEDHTISQLNLMPSVRQISRLAALHHSVSWFASELHLLRSNSDVPPASAGLEPLAATTPYTPRFQALPSAVPSNHLQLPLSREMSLRYHALLKTYEQLSSLILDTIRIEIRCRTMYYIGCSMRHGNYTLEGEAGEPDPYITNLNRELAQCDELLEKALPATKRRYIFSGLAHFMECLIIRDARLLRMPNAYGIRKVMRNILALQQSTKAWSNQKIGYVFERAKQYYSLFFISSQEMLDGIREKQAFSFDEYQAMLNLQCGVDSSTDETQRATDRNYSMYVIDLHGLEMEKGGG